LVTGEEVHIRLKAVYAAVSINQWPQYAQKAVKYFTALALLS